MRTRQHSVVQGQHSAAHSAAKQGTAAHHNGGGQPQHTPQTPTLAQHLTPRAGARPTTRATHPCTTTTANKQGMHVGHHQTSTTPHPHANTAPTTQDSQGHMNTHNTKGCLPDALLGANTFPTTPGSGGSPNVSRGVALAGGWQLATRLTIGQPPNTDLTPGPSARALGTLLRHSVQTIGGHCTRPNRGWTHTSP